MANFELPVTNVTRLEPWDELPEKKLAKVTDGLIYKHYSQARHDQ